MENKLTLGIDGMHCAACSARVEKVLSQLPGVKEANVNLTLEEAYIVYDDRKAKVADFQRAIEKIGFNVRPSEAERESEQIAQMRKAGKKMWFSWLITVLVLILMLPEMIFGTSIFGHQTDAWLMFLLSLTAMVFPARSVYVSAYKSIKSGGANMDV